MSSKSPNIIIMNQSYLLAIPSFTVLIIYPAGNYSVQEAARPVADDQDSGLGGGFMAERILGGENEVTRPVSAEIQGF